MKCRVWWICGFLAVIVLITALKNYPQAQKDQNAGKEIGNATEEISRSPSETPASEKPRETMRPNPGHAAEKTSRKRSLAEKEHRMQLEKRRNEIIGTIDQAKVDGCGDHHPLVRGSIEQLRKIETELQQP